MQYLGKQTDGKDIVNIEYLENRVGEFLVPSDILSGGKIKSELMPASVDEILEFDRKSDFPAQGEASKIYVDKQTNLTYRWGGSAYVEISPSIALGESEDTAYRGDRGKTAYDHSQTEHAVTIAGNKISSLGGNVSKETLISDLGISGKYEKPSGGIPKTDLASGVQTSLDKADSAVQPDAISDMETKTHASSTYLSKTDAEGTYLSQNDATDIYLGKTEAGNTYLSKTDAGNTYVKKSGDTMTGSLGSNGYFYSNRYNALGNAPVPALVFNKAGHYAGIGPGSDVSTIAIGLTTDDLAGWYKEIMVLTEYGTVGIGTTNPQAKLDVAGDLRASSMHDDMLATDAMINSLFA